MVWYMGMMMDSNKVGVLGHWEEVHASEYEPLDDGDEEMEEDSIPSGKKEKGKGRA